MCGIFGSTDKERFLTLYALNKKRGTFATAITLVGRNGDAVVHRWSGSVPQKEVLKHIDDMDQPVKYFLGHTQAPTSSKRKFNRETSHPFICENFLVAHNGVLSNFNDLKENFAPNWSNPVDSSIIPLVINKIEEANEGSLTVPTSIARGLSLLEGTFGLWVYDTIERQVYIARCGSTLFYNPLQNDFSSVKFAQSEVAEEGFLFQLTPEGITKVSNFDFNSPFFT